MVTADNCLLLKNYFKEQVMGSIANPMPFLMPPVGLIAYNQKINLVTNAQSPCLTKVVCTIMEAARSYIY